jgi:hypothetical protein
MGNELVDERARQASLEDLIFERPLFLIDFQSLDTGADESMTGKIGLCGYL